MKIAVLLYGHLRDFETCADSLKQNLLSRYDCDVFMHTWDERDHNSKCWHEQRFDAAHVGEETIDIIISKYNPKGIIVEHQEKYAQEKIIQSPYNKDLKMSSAIPYYMFYTMNQANQLRLDYENKNGITYDFVIVTRPDVQLKTPFEIEKFLNQIDVLGFDKDSCRFFCPYEPQWLNEWAQTLINTPNDIFFFATPTVVNKYIEANANLTEEQIEKYMVNAVSVYTANEIRHGVMPIPIRYMMDSDWDSSVLRSLRDDSKKREIKPWKKAIFGFIAILLYPIFRLQKKYQIINYYEYKKQ